MKNILMAIVFIMLLGLIGRMDYNSEVMTTKQDTQNKMEVIKDLQLRCYTGDLTGDICKGI